MLIALEIPYSADANCVHCFDCSLKFDLAKKQIFIKCCLYPFYSWTLPIISNKSILKHISFILSEVERLQPGYMQRLS